MPLDAQSDPLFYNFVEAYMEHLGLTNPNDLTINGSYLNALSHEYMTRFVDEMVVALRGMALEMNYDPSAFVMSDSYLHDLVWSGSLVETETFSNMFD